MTSKMQSHLLSIKTPFEMTLETIVSALKLGNIPSSLDALELVFYQEYSPEYRRALLDDKFMRLFGTITPVTYEGLGESLFRLVLTQKLQTASNSRELLDRRETIMGSLALPGLTRVQFYQLIGLLYFNLQRRRDPYSYRMIQYWLDNVPYS